VFCLVYRFIVCVICRFTRLYLLSYLASSCKNVTKYLYWVMMCRSNSKIVGCLTQAELLMMWELVLNSGWMCICVNCNHQVCNYSGINYGLWGYKSENWEWFQVSCEYNNWIMYCMIIVLLQLILLFVIVISLGAHLISCNHCCICTFLFCGCFITLD